MSIHPNPSFPLSSRDQIDVIRIYMELMRDGDPAGHASQAARLDQSVVREDAEDLGISGDLA